MIKPHLTTIAFFLAMATTVHAQTYKVLYNFGTNPGDPSFPSGTIAQSPGGNLYSAANGPQPDGIGSIFKMGTNGTVKVIHYFNGIDGKFPTGGLTFATDQQFHGTTQMGTGIDNKHGSIFRVTPDGKLITQYVFKAGLDGGSPMTPPIQSVSGNYYGTTPGGYDGTTIIGGSIYKITEGGEFTLLHTFNGTDYPSGLIQGTDFGFYGTTSVGGKYNQGVIFRCSSEGNFTILYNFDGTHGAYPSGGLIQAKDGNFYGTAFGGGPGEQRGVIFRLTPKLTYSVLHYFTGGTSGAYPLGLLEASDGNFYGTTYNGGGGQLNPSVVYRITPAGAYTVLHVFGIDASTSPLIQHTNGMIYGTTVDLPNDQFFRLDAGLPPFVTFLTVYGRVGAHVVILGQHFTNESVVSFNGVPAENPEIHPTYIKAIVPDGATTGTITVTTTSGTLTSNKVFVIH